MNPILSALQDRPLTYADLAKTIQSKQQLDCILLGLFRRSVIVLEGSKYKLLKPAEETRECRKCGREKPLAMFVDKSKTCDECVSKQIQRLSERRKITDALRKLGKKQCATCESVKYLYQFKPFKSGNRCKDCYTCLNKRKRRGNNSLEHMNGTTCAGRVVDGGSGDGEVHTGAIL